MLECESRQTRLCDGDTLGNYSHWKERSLLLGLAICTSCLNWGLCSVYSQEVLGLQIFSSRDSTRGIWHISPDSDVSSWRWYTWFLFPFHWLKEVPQTDVGQGREESWIHLGMDPCPFQAEVWISPTTHRNKWTAWFNDRVKGLPPVCLSQNCKDWILSPLWEPLNTSWIFWNF